MTLNPTLVSGDYTKLRSTAYNGATYVSVLSNTVVYSGLVNGTPSTPGYAQFDVDTTTGDYADVRAGMRVQVAVTDSFEDIILDGRIRKATGSGSTLFVGETSANILDNYAFRVIDDFPVAPRKPRINGGVFFVDFDEAFEQLPPRITGLQSAYAGFTSGGVLTISFAPTVTATADGATISTYEWSVGDGTITTGTAASKDITATFPAGERWVHLTVTDSNGTIWTRHILVLAYDDTDDAGLFLSYEQITINNRVGEGVTASLTAFADTSEWLSRQLIVVWTTDDYAGDAAAIDNNIAFYGRRATTSDSASYTDDGGVDQDTQLEFDGTLAQLGEVIAFAFTLDDIASAVDWFQVESLTVWRGMWLILTRLTTAANVVDVLFDDTTDTLRIGDTDTQGATAYEQLADLAQSIAAALQEGRDGRIGISRYAVLLEEAEARANVPTVATWTTADWTRLSVRRDDVDTLASVTLYAGAFNPTTGVTTPYKIQAPGDAFGAGANHVTVNRQIVRGENTANALFDARKRAGNEAARRQPVREIRVEHLDGYWWFVPDVRAYVTLDVPAAALYQTGAIANTLRWWCREVSVTHNATDGNRPTVSATYVEETEGREGQFIQPDIVEVTPFTPPDPVVFPEPDPGIEPGELPLDEIDTGGGGTGSYDATDDAVDADCSGGGSLNIGGWDFTKKCVEGQGISLQYNDLPRTTVTMTLSLDGASVGTSTFTIEGTEVLQALDDTFLSSVEADRVDVTLTFATNCIDGGVRIFSVRVPEDQYSEGCNNAFPEIVDFGELSFSAGGQIEELGTLDFDIIAAYIEVEGPACGPGRFGQAAFRYNTNSLIGAGTSSGNPGSGFSGGQDQLDLLVQAQIVPSDNTFTPLGEITTAPAGGDLTVTTGSSAVNPDTCYDGFTAHVWAVVDLNS